MLHHAIRRVSCDDRIVFVLLSFDCFSWSYGVLLWEIFSLGGAPYPNTVERMLIKCFERGERMRQPINCPPDMYDLHSYKNIL